MKQVSHSSIEKLQQTATLLRSKIIEYSFSSRTPHLASCLSCVDILTAYYFHILEIDPKNPNDDLRDRFVLSKGHAAPALFNTLAMAGFFPESRLLKAKHDGTDIFGEHPPAPQYLAGIEAATGSLGHGLPIGLGFAIASKVKNQNNRVDVLIGDGESNEGTIWETALLGASRKLANLTVIVDFNKWQATDRSQNVMAIDPMADKWRAFGWHATEIDGHNMMEIINALTKPIGDKPRAVIAHTIKGKGVSFMQNDNNWHYKIPTSEEVQAAKYELGTL
ncbi:transketolase, beta subunit [SAR116 cluster alpha proteobacterium HIMB100]|nr:transketolase, beta subunit [SAR116 cluster alpha proteobacterium HIMB100]